jgi:hypothetical protein
MKKNSLLVSCGLALTIAAGPLSAAGERKSPDDLVPFPSRPFIAKGLERESVILMLGQPSAKLSPDIWVYFDFRPVDPRESSVYIERPQTVDTALVIFESDRVVHIRLCDSKPVRAFLARLERKPPLEPPIAVRHPPALLNSAKLP